MVSFLKIMFKTAFEKMKTAFPISIDLERIKQTYTVYFRS